tara:strand:+ start:213 stop:458 length:246 start_codon:yes stop_codon:yes gene_type:complete
MKTYTQFQEDMNKFMKDTVMNNPGVKKITTDLKQGNININNLKNFAKSDDAKNLRNTAINMLLKVGQNKLDKLKTKASNMQ